MFRGGIGTGAAMLVLRFVFVNATEPYKLRVMFVVEHPMLPRLPFAATSRRPSKSVYLQASGPAWAATVELTQAAVLDSLRVGDEVGTDLPSNEPLPLAIDIGGRRTEVPGPYHACTAGGRSAWCVFPVPCPNPAPTVVSGRS